MYLKESYLATILGRAGHRITSQSLLEPVSFSSLRISTIHIPLIIVTGGNAGLTRRVSYDMRICSFITCSFAVAETRHLVENYYFTPYSAR